MSFHEDTKLWVVLLVVSFPRIHHYHQFDLLHFQVRCACNSSIQIFLINIDNQKIFFLFFFLSGVQSHTKYINSLPNSNCTLIVNIKVEIPCILQTKTLWLLQVLEDNFWVLHWNMSNYTSFMARINSEMRKILLTDRQIIWKFRERERGREMRERKRKGMAYQSEGKLSDEQSMDKISPRRAAVHTMHTTLPRSTQTPPRGPSLRSLKKVHNQGYSMSSNKRNTYMYLGKLN